MKPVLFILSIVFLSLSCSSPESEKKEPKTEENKETSEPLSIADQLVKDAVAYHGGDKYDNASVSFSFRDRDYSFKNQGDSYTYTRTSTANEEEVYDVLTNTEFKRTINGKTKELPDSMTNAYSSSVNSVIYFATLPHKLNDASVKKAYKGTTEIKGAKYEVVEVRFSEEGGGEDYDDIYYYWFQKETHSMDYFAYSYHVNEGGVRFRASYNPKRVGGILFQDYINYKAPIGTPLENLPALFEYNKLEELSRIESEDIHLN